MIHRLENIQEPELFSVRQAVLQKPRLEQHMNLLQVNSLKMLILNHYAVPQTVARDIELDLKGTKLVVRVVSTLVEAEKSLKEIKEGKAPFQLLEVMACPGGCINGGGQPRSCDDSKIKGERAQGLYKEDSELPLRKSHMNPSIQKLYQEYLEHPNSHKAHELLHTVYNDKFTGSYKDI